jgi:methylase of polypeptide subunit release factors
MGRFHVAVSALLDGLPGNDPDARGALIAALAEESLEPGSRARHGAVYTGRTLAGRVLEEGLRALGEPAARVLDPACGAGDFLAAAATHPRISGAFLRGLDRDAAALAAARVRLDPAGTVPLPSEPRRDSAAPPEANFDLVIGNPPYVRQEALGGPAARRPRAARLERLLPGAAAAIGGRADLSIAFMLLGLSRLRPGGVLAFVTSNAWLDTRYGAPFRRFLAEHAEVRLIAEREERAFARAAVNRARRVEAARRPAAGRRAICRRPRTRPRARRAARGRSPATARGERRS